MTALHCPINILKDPDALNICRDCGIVLTGVTQKTPCPPWSSEEKKEETSDREELENVLGWLSYVESWHQWQEFSRAHKDAFLRAERFILNSIQKLEAQK